VRLAQPVGDVEADGRAQRQERVQQQRRGRLAVHVKIAPDQDRLASGHHFRQRLDRLSHLRQVVRGGGAIARRIKEGEGRFRRGHAPLSEDLRDQGVAANRAVERGGNPVRAL